MSPPGSPRATGSGFWQEALQIIRLVRRIFHARAGRRRGGVHFLDPDVALFAHPKILVTRSIPRTSAATSCSLL
jgi:hypothetical protein